MLLPRLAAVWLLLAVVAVAFGVLRGLLLEPRVGAAAAHVVPNGPGT